ncbi:MAG: substrate-binding domain-containing protein [Lachnospiraceae bacterium]
MKLKGLAIVSLVMLSLLAGGCAEATSNGGKKEKKDDDRIHIGMSFDSFVIERWITDRNVFVSTAEGAGAVVNVQSANGDVETQIDQIRYLIDQEVDVIVVVPIDCGSLSDVLLEAKEKGIKVISYDRLALDSNVDLYISFDNEEVGRLMGDAIKEELGPEGGGIYMICGPDTDANAVEVEKGFSKAMENSNITVLYKTRCENWNAMEGYEAVKTALENYPEVDAIMCGNDDIATQVFMDLSENRLAGKVLLTGQDCDLMACQRIVQGTQLVSVYKSFETEAKAAAENAIRLAKGEDINVDSEIFDGKYTVKYLELEPLAVTADNIDSIIVDGGVHTEEEVYSR